MPVGIGVGPETTLQPGSGPGEPAPRGYHPGALWLAAAAPVMATLLLLARLAA